MYDSYRCMTRALSLAMVALVFASAAALAGVANRAQRYARQNADDRDRHQQFDQRKAVPMGGNAR